MNSQDDKLKFEQWDSTKIKKWLENKDYVYKDLILDSHIWIKKLWPELNSCCIINFRNMGIGIYKFIRENETTLECLKNTLIIPWENDGNPFFELKSLKNSDSEIKHISGIDNFDVCLVILKPFIERYCKSASISEIQKCYYFLLSFKAKIEQRYNELYNYLNNSEANIWDHGEFYNSRVINSAFSNIDEYLKNLLSLIQINIEKKKNDKKDEQFDKTFNQNRWLGRIAIFVSGAGVISGIIVPLIIKFCFK